MRSIWNQHESHLPDFLKNLRKIGQYGTNMNMNRIYVIFLKNLRKIGQYGTNMNMNRIYVIFQKFLGK